MRSYNWLRSAAFVAGLVISVFVASPAEATVALQLDRPQLVEMSDLVVRVTVGNVSYRWNEDHSQILTLTRLTVTQYLKGDGPVELVLRQFGGELDGLASRVSGDGALAPGQDAVLCLRRGAGVVYLTALAQSVWYVTAQPGVAPAVHRDLSGLTLTRVVNGRMRVLEQVSTDAPEALSHLVSDVTTQVRAGVRR